MKDLDESDVRADAQRMEDELARRALRHVDYPHEPNTLYGCAPCEASCEHSHPSDEDVWCVAWASQWTEPREFPRGAVGYEARCQKCGEMFNPHSPEPEDLVHFVRSEDGTECGGQGVLVGAWY